MNTWFTSDFHLGHANIIKYCKRPFKDLFHMDSSIIRNHNQRVKPEDIIYFLGDFCLSRNKAKYYLKQLNGKFVFIKGNHDDNNSLKVATKSAVIEFGGKTIFLVHNPLDLDKKYPINFVGHVHQHWKFKRAKEGIDMINVGVDVNNFMPISFDEIMKEYNEWVKEGRR